MKKIHHIMITPVSNGFNMEVHQLTAGKTSEPSYYHDTNKLETIHPSAEHLGKHLHKMLKGHSIKNAITAKSLSSKMTTPAENVEEGEE